MNASLVPEVELRVLGFPKFSLYGGSGGWAIGLNPLQLQLRWRDSRLKTSPCAKVMPLLYSLEAGSERDTANGRVQITEKARRSTRSCSEHRSSPSRLGTMSMRLFTRYTVVPRAAASVSIGVPALIK